MQTVVAAAQRQLSALERFLGPDTHVVNNESQAITSLINLEWIDVELPEGNQPDDQGMLYLFPVDDGQFCLYLFFLEYEETATLGTSVCALRFLPGFFSQYPEAILMANQPFRFDQSTEQQFPVCSQSRSLISQLRLTAASTPFIRSLQQHELSMALLRRALECISIPFMACPVPACRFLADESEKDKIRNARVFLEQNIDRPVTIRELARKVAMNECYLKKGFKAIVGKTIHDYQQELRINKARQLLQQDGLTVTEVANTLGFSSISHFSTAFKRITGLKPCELLSW
jgi:AraC-like DNA-binding protein